MRIPDIFSTVLTAQAAPPMVNDSLNWERELPRSVFPFAVWQAGRLTMVSRGIDMTLALWWPS